MLRIELGYDSDVLAPWDECDYEWKVISFHSRDFNYENPYNYIRVDRQHGDYEFIHPGIRMKAKYGLAFMLSRYEHSGVTWSMFGEGMQCPWDTTRYGGVLVWPHDSKKLAAKAHGEREQAAREFLVRYNSWCNGECYFYNIIEIIDDKEEHIDSCGGFVGSDELFDALHEALRDHRGEPYEIVGEAAWLCDHCNVFDEEERNGAMQ